MDSNDNWTKLDGFDEFRVNRTQQSAFVYLCVKCGGSADCSIETANDIAAYLSRHRAGCPGGPPDEAHAQRLEGIAAEDARRGL